jgi:hypothetical protein
VVTGNVTGNKRRRVPGVTGESETVGLEMGFGPFGRVHTLEPV